LISDDRHVLSKAGKHLKSSFSFDSADEDLKRLTAEQASRFRAALMGESRSVTLAHLFDYLLERSRDPRAPKEIEVAMAVFGKSTAFDTSQDSTVRVHIHRLRQRLESFNAGKRGMLLQIPKGQYRLLLAGEPESPNENVTVLDQPRSRSGQKRLWAPIAICFAATAALWTTIFLASSRASPVNSPLGHTSFWKAIATHKRLPLIAAGDFYMALESGPDGKIERLSMRPTIRSGRDLDNYLRMHPDQYGTLRDRDIRRVPANVATGAAAILPLVASMRPDQSTSDIIPASQISQEIIDSNDVIYIEHFSELGMLRSPVLSQSRFASGPDPDEVKDVPSGRTFRARPASDNPLNGNAAKDPYGYDYGYIASYSGPSGNQILVISGIEDAALAQMVKLVSDKRQLDLLSRMTGGANAFEALYQVRTAGVLIFDTSLVIARALEADKREAPSL